MIRYQFLRFPEGKCKAVTLSYDDGCEQDLRFSDIITKAGLKCTFNLNNNILRNGRLSDEDIKKYFLDRGHEIAIHGAKHSAQGYQRPIEGIKEVLNNRLELEQRFDRIIRGMAYPDSGIVFYENGANYETIRTYLKDLDIAYARSLGSDNSAFRIPSDWHNWIPTAHHKNPNLMEFIEKFKNMDPSKGWHSSHSPRLFYLWGHSFEFDMDNNWELLDEICEKLSGLEDVWYATNIEIYDYVKAYQSLVHSADGTMVYNPTLITVWFETDGKTYSVKPGETIRVDKWDGSI